MRLFHALTEKFSGSRCVARDAAPDDWGRVTRLNEAPGVRASPAPRMFRQEHRVRAASGIKTPTLVNEVNPPIRKGSRHADF
jgi:hypothetical protein